MKARVALAALSVLILVYYAKYFQLSLMTCFLQTECGKREAMDITPVVYDMYRLTKETSLQDFDIDPQIIRIDSTQALESRAVEFLYTLRYLKTSNNIFVPPESSSLYLNCLTIPEVPSVKLCSKTN